MLIILSAIVSFLAVEWIYGTVLKIAKDKNLVDNPDARKLQKTPVPVLGGIAVFFGIICGLALSVATNNAISDTNFSKILPVVFPMLIMLYLGASDDILGLSPTSRFFFEIVSVISMIYASDACIDSLHGLWGVNKFSWGIAVPLTVFAGVGIINAMNMIDGVNGLSSGLCIACCSLFGYIFFRVGDFANCTMAIIVAASLLPFLLHNVFGNKSRMFIGDAGTMVLGMLMVWFTISVLRSDRAINLYSKTEGINMVALSLAILSVPIFDTLRVMTMRILQKKSPFHPDKTHLHHAILAVGTSHSITALTEIMIDISIVGIWMVTKKLGAAHDIQLYTVIGAAMLLVWGLFFVLNYHTKRQTPFFDKLKKITAHTHMGHTGWWLKFQEFLDKREITDDKKSK